VGQGHALHGGLSIPPAQPAEEIANRKEPRQGMALPHKPSKFRLWEN